MFLVEMEDGQKINNTSIDENQTEVRKKKTICCKYSISRYSIFMAFQIPGHLIVLCFNIGFADGVVAQVFLDHQFSQGLVFQQFNGLLL